MAEAISNCEALLCRGMGMGAYLSVQVRYIGPVVTDIVDIDEAIQAYIEGHIVDRVEKLHREINWTELVINRNENLE